MAVSRFMQPEHLLSACLTKGIHILGTGDALHPLWRKTWEPFLENDAGTVILPTSEVEDEHRVHHLILAADFSQFNELQELLKGTCKSFSPVVVRISTFLVRKSPNMYTKSGHLLARHMRLLHGQRCTRILIA